MSALIQRVIGIGGGLVDRANPLLVRHIRQELRNRGFIGIFMLLLLAAVLASLFMAGTASGRSEGQAGRWLFGLLAVALSFALWVAQPIAAFRAMMRERDEDTWDLIDLTGMRPAGILRGILQATLVQGMVYTAAIAPFMLMAYLLRGLDILTVVLMTIGIVLVGAQATAFAIFWACLGPNKATRGVLFVLLVLGLMISWFASWVPMSALASGELVSFFTLSPGESWTLLGLWFNAWLDALVLVLVLAAALLTFRAGNRSTLPRLVWLGIALNGLFWIFAYAAAFEGSDWFGEACLVSGVLLTAWALPLGLFAATEDRAISPRQARWIRSGKPLASLTSWFLGPGESRGSFCYVLLAVVAVTMATIGGAMEEEAEVARVCGVLLGHLCFYLALTQIMAAGPMRSLLDTPAAKRVLCLAMIIAVSVIQLMVQLFVDGGFPPLNVLSPIWSAVFVGGGRPYPHHIGETVQGATAIGVVIVSGAGLGLLLISAAKGLLSTETLRVHARADDRNPRGG